MSIALHLTDYMALSPLLVVLATALALLLVEAFIKAEKNIALSIAVFGQLIAILAVCRVEPSTNALITNWIQFDSFSKFFSILFLSIGSTTAIVSSLHFRHFHASRGEFYFFLVSSVFGLILISSANDFLTLFLGIETLSIALYVLCGYMKGWMLAQEAAFKYFLLGAVATSFLLFGIAFIYGAYGTTRFDLLHKDVEGTKMLFLTGISFVTLGLFFKAAVVPFHIWAPDVYDGAPTPVTAFMAVGTKAASFAALIRVFMYTFDTIDVRWHEIVSYLVYPTLIYANFVAIRQTQLRRFFAYSGISHAGFLLIPLVSLGPDAMSSMLFYIVVYTIATLGAFSVLAFLDDKSEGVLIDDLQGLFYTHPMLSSILTLSLLTLGGIPPTIGFFAKLYVLKVGYAAGYYGLVVVGLLTTIFAAYYYLRFVSMLFTKRAEHEKEVTPSMLVQLVGVFSFVSILALSCYPKPLLQTSHAVEKEFITQTQRP